jgi:hypothetical protein
MPTFKRCDSSVEKMAKALISEFETNYPLEANEVRIDYLFAYGDRDEVSGELITDALKKGGMKCLGITRKLSLKDRSKGLGDAEICLDGDYWAEASDAEKRSLLDHELHHLAATAKRDDLGRPIIKLRLHDVEFGWFAVVAARHGDYSQERMQARRLMDKFGQFFWPDIAESYKHTSRFHKLESLDKQAVVINAETNFR